MIEGIIARHSEAGAVTLDMDGDTYSLRVVVEGLSVSKKSKQSTHIHTWLH